jgi:hypothetical protein
LALLSCNAILTLITLLSEFSGRSSVLFVRWPITLACFLASVAFNGYAICWVYGLESNWAVVWGVMIFVALVLSASPFWIFGGFRTIICLHAVSRMSDQGLGRFLTFMSYYDKKTTKEPNPNSWL